MKTIRDFLVVLALTASIAFADGHTGGGTRCDTCSPPPCTENCGGSYEEGVGSGELVTTVEEENDDDSLVEYWQEIFFDFFG